MAVALYARVSTSKQADKDLSIRKRGLKALLTAIG
jgi:DNA invertase Pin-like site-specific DNA recombinase